jgi:hypothetical protein
MNRASAEAVLVYLEDNAEVRAFAIEQRKAELRAAGAEI